MFVDIPYKYLGLTPIISKDIKKRDVLIFFRPHSTYKGAPYNFYYSPKQCGCTMKTLEEKRIFLVQIAIPPPTTYNGLWVVLREYGREGTESQPHRCDNVKNILHNYPISSKNYTKTFANVSLNLPNSFTKLYGFKIILNAFFPKKVE